MEEKKRVEPVRLTYEGQEYTLEFNLRAIKRMETNGFSTPRSDALKPATYVTELFHGAFFMHHKTVTPEFAEKIWNAMTHRSELVTRLTRLYSQAINDLMGENEAEDDEGENPTWR